MPQPDPKSHRRLIQKSKAIAYRLIRRIADVFDRFRRTPPPFDGRVPPPDRVTIETTRYCNLTCRMCMPYLDGITVTGPHLDPEKFQAYARQIFPFVKLFQPSVSGEPLMSKGLPEMIELAREWGVKLDIVTNGSLLTERLIELLVPVVGRMTFSIDGATAEVFEHIRRGADFEKVVRNMRAFIAKARTLPASHRPLIGFNSTLMRQNIHQLPAIVALAADIGATYVHATHVIPASAEMRDSSLLHDQELAKRYLDEAAEVAGRTGVNFSVAPLDQFIAANAVSSDDARRLATADGVIPGMEARQVGERFGGEAPTLSADAADFTEIQARRAAFLASADVPPHHPTSRFPKRQPPIWVCSFLWHATYVQLEGGVRPCCMPEPPEIGNL